MRLINVIPAVSNEASGPSYSVVRLCESLIDSGRDVVLASLDWSPIDSPKSYFLRFSIDLAPKRLGISTGLRNWLETEARMGSISLIHNHSLWMMPNVYTGRTARHYKIPYVVSPRGTLSSRALKNGSFAKKLFWPFYQYPSLKSVSCFHATAMSEYDDIRNFGFRQPVAVIPNGIDLPVLYPTKKNKIRTLLFLGRIHPIKGVDILLKAWKIVQQKHTDWRLLIVGPDNQGFLKKMISMSKNLGLKRVEFMDPVYGSEKFSVYSNSDLFVLPTHSENFGISVAEALASGVPAIVTKGAPWSGLVSQDAGWWIDIGLDPLVECLNRALDMDYHQLGVKGKNGREWMKRDFTWNRIGNQMSVTYDWIMNGGAKPDWVFID
jgi:glycosyltransferase involved in cell wall biosynthesis